MSSQPRLRHGCGAAGATGGSWGLWCRPTDTTETAAGSSTEVSERTPLPPSSWDEASAAGVPGTRPFLCNERAAGGAGRAAERDGREPLSLPLLHALHLQTEGGEAGQQVGHFVHLREETKAL